MKFIFLATNAASAATSICIAKLISQAAATSGTALPIFFATSAANLKAPVATRPPVTEFQLLSISIMFCKPKILIKVKNS